MTSSSGSIDQSRLFAIGFAAIAATSFCFVLRALVVDSWGVEFNLSETQKGELLGVGLWPFAISIVLLSLCIDRIGFRWAMILASICHLGGLMLLFFANGYWTLYIGTFVMALGNGAVEAAVNPMIATAYSDDKPRWLNRLHAGWPGGLILGGILAMLLGDLVGWRVKILLMALPVVAYTALSFRQRFPESECAARGIPYRAMLAEAGYLSAFVILSLIMMELGRVFALSSIVTWSIVGGLTLAYGIASRSAGRPMFVLLLILMIPLATTELGTDSWISSLMEPEMRALGLHGGWVLVYTSAIMFGMRLVAGSIIAVLTPLGTLACASAAAALGLFLLGSSGGMLLLAAATLYGIGKSFFWGTSLAVASEQYPRGGAITINLIGGAGMLAGGVMSSVLLGTIQDGAVERGLRDHDRSHQTSYVARYVVQQERGILGDYRALDRSALASAPPADRKLISAVEAGSRKQVLKTVSFLPLVMLLTYIAMIVYFAHRGGYAPVDLALPTEPGERRP